MPIQVPIGLPGPGTVIAAAHKHVFRGNWEQYLPGGKLIDGSLSRDPTNTGYLTHLQPGLVMGKVTSGGLYANSFYGLSTGALTSVGTTLTAAAATITELLRRGGATGTFKLTGPPTAGGVVRTMTVTYSAASGTSITIAALGVNEVQTVNLNIAATGGNIVLRVPKPNGEFALTTPAAWSATDATFLANINTVLDAATGVAGGIVASAIPATDTDLGFKLTFSGTGYAGLPQPTEEVSVETLPTSSTSYYTTRTTAGVDGRFVTASLIQPVDGSETPITFIPDGYPIRVADDAGNTTTVPFPAMPLTGVVESAQIINYPSDSSLKAWLKLQFSNAGLHLSWDDSF